MKAASEDKASDLKLVRLAKEDLAEVLLLERLCYAQPWTMANFVGEFERSITVALGFKQGQTLLGHCFFWLIKPEIHLLNLAVVPQARRQGLGRRLLNAMLAFGLRAGVDFVFLEARSSNEPALSLYRSVGFQSSGLRPNYYDDGEDALLMTLELSGAEKA